MKISELKEKIDKLLDDGVSGDEEVVILTKDHSIGQQASVGIQSISRGFDWETGLILIQPKKSIYKSNRDRAVALLDIAPDIAHMTVLICPTCGKSTDKIIKYCSNCGQKFTDKVKIAYHA